MVVYDHNVPAGLPEESKIFQEILQYARKEKIPFYQAKGIAQKWMLEENMVAPTDIIITGTRHSSIFGSIGALGSVSAIRRWPASWKQGSTRPSFRKRVTVRVIGKLRRGVGIIDVASIFLMLQAISKVKPLNSSVLTLRLMNGKFSVKWQQIRGRSRPLR